MDAFLLRLHHEARMHYGSLAAIRRWIVVAFILGLCAPTLAVAQPTITARDTILPELFGLGGFQVYPIKVKLSAASSQTITVVADFTGVSAEKGTVCGSTADFFGGPRTLTFSPNTTEQTINLSICGDALVEGNETLKLTLSNPVNATVGTPATITIADDDGVAQPRVFISAVTPNSSLYESVPSTLNPIFTVKVSPPSTQPVEVKYQFVDGTATRGSACSGATDYVATSSTLLFAPGDTMKTVSAVICADTHVDAQIETFTFQLTSATNAVMGSATQSTGSLPTTANTSRTLQIFDNDRPIVTVSGSGVETNSGQPTIAVTLRLDKARTEPFVLQYSTALAGFGSFPATSGTSCIGSADYIAVPPTNVTFAPNELTKAFTVTICGDTLIERDEQFQLVLTSPNGPELSPSSGGGIKIINDDMPRVSVPDVTIHTSTSDTPVDVEVSVLLAPKAAEPATVSYTTMNGSLTGGQACTGSVGYVLTSGTLSFAGGPSDVPAGAGAVPGNFTNDFTQTRKFTVKVCKRSTASTVAVKILLSNPTNAKLGDAGAIKILP
jgi:hypothetical protein